MAYKPAGPGAATSHFKFTGPTHVVHPNIWNNAKSFENKTQMIKAFNIIAWTLRANRQNLMKTVFIVVKTYIED